MHYLFLILLCLAFTGCTRLAQPATPEEQEAQEEKMREFLNDSSPRNMNQQPKAIPEFTKRFNTTRRPDTPTREETDKAKENGENW